MAKLDRDWDDTWSVAAGFATSNGGLSGWGFGVSYESSVVDDDKRTIDLPLDVLLGNREPTEEIKTTTKVKKAWFAGTSFKDELDRKYRDRALANHLRSVDLFREVSPEFIEKLRTGAELLTFVSGESSSPLPPK